MVIFLSKLVYGIVYNWVYEIVPKELSASKLQFHFLVGPVQGFLEYDHQEGWLLQYLSQIFPAVTALKFDD